MFKWTRTSYGKDVECTLCETDPKPSEFTIHDENYGDKDMCRECFKNELTVEIEILSNTLRAV